MECHASMIAWYTQLLNDAEKEVKRLERHFEIWYAETYDFYFRELTEGTKKPSIANVENEIKCTEQYKIRQTYLDSSKHKLTVLKGVIEWYKEKGHMMAAYIRLIELELRSLDNPKKKENDRQDFEDAQHREAKNLSDKMKNMDQS